MSKRIKHDERRMASFRLRNDTMAKLHFLIEENLAHSMTMLIENFITMRFNNYIKDHDISEADALSTGFKRMGKKAKPKDDTEVKENARIIRDMEIQRAKEEYQRRTGETDRELEESMRFGNMTLEEVLMAAGTLSRDYDK